MNRQNIGFRNIFGLFFTLCPSMSLCSGLRLASGLDFGKGEASFCRLKSRGTREGGTSRAALLLRRIAHLIGSYRTSIISGLCHL